MITLRLTIATAAIVAVLFLAAGRLDVWQFWAWGGVMWLTSVVAYALLARYSPELVAERMKPPSDRDRATRRLVALPFLGLLVVAGLDARFGWSDVPLLLQLGGLALVALGFVLVGWVLLTNPFASSAVRIQAERGQRVISSGPYGIVRHPMYLAVVLVCAGTGPALASWYAWPTLAPVVAIFIRRTLVEDRMLHEELEGYAEYAKQVRYRVVPFVF